MSESRSAYRYALAIIGVAEELHQLEKVNENFILIQNAIKGSREFYLFLKSPIVNKEKKKKLLDEVFRNSVSDLTLKFIRLIADKEREKLLPEIILQFNALRDQRLGIIDVTVTTVTDMTNEQRKQLTDRLQTATHKTIRLQEKLDSQLIGGFTVRYEDTVWDGSVRRQLETLKERLIHGTT